MTMYELPYGNTQQLNLDWFIKRWQEFYAQWQATEAGIDHALDAEVQRVEDAMTDLYAARDAAAASATAAAASATSASNDATIAANAATAAAASATLANTKATAAGLSEAAAALSASQAANDATAAATSASQASASASSATDSAQAAAASATAADSSADDAADSATAAAGSATAAAGSASDAADSATAAAASAASLVVDSAMSDSSTNPVQNKVINGELTELKTALNDVVIISNTQPVSEDNKIWIDSDADSVQVPTMDDYNALLDCIPTATTESAEVAIITDGSQDLPIKKLTVSSEATKLTRIGKNLIPSFTGTKSDHGVDFTMNNDGSVHAEGTVNTSTWVYITILSGTIASLKLEVGDTLALHTSDGSMLAVNFYNSESTRISFKTATSVSGATITIPENTVSMSIMVYASSSTIPASTEVDKDIYCQTEIANSVTSWQRYYGKEYDLTDGIPDEAVTTVYGYNRLWADTGNISVEYRQDLGILINSLS